MSTQTTTVNANVQQVTAATTENTSSSFISKISTDAKLLTLACEITGMDQESLVKIGIWATLSKEELIKRFQTLDYKNGNPVELFNSIFADAPVKPDFNLILENIIAKFNKLLDKVADLIEVWLGKKVADDFISSINTAMETFKSQGAGADWTAKKEYLKKQFEEVKAEFDKLSHLSETSQTAEVKKTVAKTTPVVAAKKYPAESPFNISFC